MSFEIFSHNTLNLIQHPQVVSKEQAHSFETEVDLLIKKVSKEKVMSAETHQKYEKLSDRIHKVAELNPQLKGVDDTFHKLITNLKSEQVQNTSVSATQVPRPIRDNPMNTKELQAWIKAYKHPLIIDALTELTGCIRHISQQEFEESL